MMINANNSEHLKTVPGFEPPAHLLFPKPETMPRLHQCFVSCMVISFADQQKKPFHRKISMGGNLHFKGSLREHVMLWAFTF
jgi:hypothetical protein